MYYTEQELKSALGKAKQKYVALLAEHGFVRGTSDCLGLAIQFDKELRGSKSVLGDLIDFEFNCTLSFIQGIIAKGWTAEDIFTNNNFELLELGTEPQIGDFAYTQGVNIWAGSHWLSVDNEGNFEEIQYSDLFNDPNLIVKLHGRPLKV